MIKKLEKCIKRYINDNLTKDWYDEEEFGDKINEIIEYINKKEEITVTIPKGEYNIWGNNHKEKGFSILENLTINETGLNRGYSDLFIKQYIAENYIFKKELKEKINAIDIKHISSNEMFRIEVLDLIQDF